MQDLNFIKMEALGNDYIYVVEEKNEGLGVEKLIKQIPAMSNRFTGIGSDGLILIGRDEKDIWCRIFNADASEAMNCGNGVRCVARLCYDLNWTSGSKDFNILLKKANVSVRVTVEREAVAVNMGKVMLTEKEALDFKGAVVEFVRVNVTNPHAVILNKDFDSELASFIEKHKAFPDRTNVEFFKVTDKQNIEMRVWERGSAETKACGTGAVAVFMYLYSKGLCSNSAYINMPGGRVLVSMEADGSILLTGPANYVFKGKSLLRS